MSGRTRAAARPVAHRARSHPGAGPSDGPGDHRSCRGDRHDGASNKQIRNIVGALQHRFSRCAWPAAQMMPPREVVPLVPSSKVPTAMVSARNESGPGVNPPIERDFAWPCQAGDEQYPPPGTGEDQQLHRHSGGKCRQDVAARERVFRRPRRTSGQDSALQGPGTHPGEHVNRPDRVDGGDRGAAGSLP